MLPLWLLPCGYPASDPLLPMDGQAAIAADVEVHLSRQLAPITGRVADLEKAVAGFGSHLGRIENMLMEMRSGGTHASPRRAAELDA